MDGKNVLGERIRHYRKLHRFTQAALAAELGVASKYISNIEEGYRNPSYDMLIQICERFQIETSDLLPVNKRDDSEAKERMIAEINAALRSLKNDQVGFVRDMLCAMSGK